MLYLFYVLLLIFFQCGFPDEYKFQDTEEVRDIYGIELFIERNRISEGDFTFALVRIINRDGKKEDAESSNISWSSENIEIAEVDSTGKITGIKPGSSSIVAELGEYSTSSLIQVEEYVDYSKILINEIFYDAAGSDSGLEFIEIYNGNSIQCDLSGFSLHDGNPGSGIFIFPENSMILPGGYLLVAQDSDKFSQLFGIMPDISGLNFQLNNSGETISLADVDMKILDRVFIEGGYSAIPVPESWGSGNLPSAAEGESIHRINHNDSDTFNDWVSGNATPGY